MRVTHVVGARPNFMKAAPVVDALSRYGAVEQSLVHTGQHYDANMSGVFFSQLGLRAPDVNLGVGSGSHAAQTARLMLAFEPVLASRPDWVVVYGDVNSTLAATLVCAKAGVPVAHVEAGLRSFDRSMPEELNRIATDQLADLLLTPSEDADENLAREGIASDRIRRVGNVMIDTLLRMLPAARPPDGVALAPRYVLVTLHRPSNVDDPALFGTVLEALADIAQSVQVVFPVHPRTQARIREWLENRPDADNMLFLDPQGYLPFLALQRDAVAVITDSGGIQEETTYLGVPCLTVRENTERPITVSVGTNTLVGRDPQRLRSEVEKILSGGAKRGQVPPLWDGKASERIADALVG